jgi:hypothetical protein
MNQYNTRSSDIVEVLAPGLVEIAQFGIQLSRAHLPSDIHSKAQSHGLEIVFGTGTVGNIEPGAHLEGHIGSLVGGGEEGRCYQEQSTGPR